MKREVDPRLDDAEDKGRGYVLALIDVILIKYRRPDLTAYACVADECVAKKGKHPNNPNRCKNGDPYLQGIGAITGGRGEGLAYDGIYGTVEYGDSCVDGWRMISHNIRTYHLGARDQAEHALNGEGANKTYRHDAPKKHRDPFGCLAKKQAQ